MLTGDGRACDSDADCVDYGTYCSSRGFCVIFRSHYCHLFVCGLGDAGPLYISLAKSLATQIVSELICIVLTGR